MPEVRNATSDDLPTIGRVLAAAFEGDPVWEWMTSPRADWHRRSAAWFEREARSQMRAHGEVLVDEDLRGVAIWAPPGHWKGNAREAAALMWPSLRLFGARMPRALRALITNERLHPVEPPHWYLAILGTDPAHQGSGVGSALISAVTERCDTQGLGAYLESSKEQNLAFYARHGFEVRQALKLPNGPPVWTMWRDPRD